MTEIKFSEMLKEFLEKKQITTAELSNLSGVSEANLSRYKNNDVQPRFNHIIALRRAGLKIEDYEKSIKTVN